MLDNRLVILLSDTEFDNRTDQIFCSIPRWDSSLKQLTSGNYKISFRNKPLALLASLLFFFVFVKIFGMIFLFLVSWLIPLVCEIRTTINIIKFAKLFVNNSIFLKFNKMLNYEIETNYVILVHASFHASILIWKRIFLSPLIENKGIFYITFFILILFQRILGSTDNVGNVIRSCKDETFLQTGLLHQRISRICKEKVRSPVYLFSALAGYYLKLLLIEISE